MCVSVCMCVCVTVCVINCSRTDSTFCFEPLVPVNMFFGCHKPVFDKFLYKRFGHCRRSSADFTLKYSLRAFKKCRGLCFRLVKVGTEYSSNMCHPPVSGITEQTLPFKAFPFTPFEHAISILSITHDEFDSQGSLTALLPD